ncbi:hypothetical protein FOCG_07589 [Fusarium oxysporum f. sp. radicis-lycopersici 26381]|uniref:Uncharacterized protein n=1 Tax=Fusarium oxysporum Fo47 TaxID=660027 RepID=W9JEE5_FUSOX|nr:hypothetical protein FOZG_15920 [Fusarium oxysporum Fo47]EWZ85351.1 hypothetical protein FOWG_11853 [Fusarium oxysporum f. sp. lycopersici MN25]EXL51766.1 hypothetical protein FOCG_07589 [Fusarium oxysporum f. sp. radicis-lycopersici 26381]
MRVSIFEYHNGREYNLALRMDRMRKFVMVVGLSIPRCVANPN